mgnify:CR=1 FL=1
MQETLEIFSHDLKIRCSNSNGAQSGCFDLFSKSGRYAARNAFCSVKMDKKEYSTIGRTCIFSQSPHFGSLGEGTQYTIKYESNPDDLISFRLDFYTYNKKGEIFGELTIKNILNSPITIESMDPFVACKSKNGGVFVGSTPESSLIFENGFTFAIDFFMRCEPASEETESNWMSLIYSKNRKENFLFGFISKASEITECITNDIDSEGLEFEGRIAIPEFRAKKIFIKGKQLMPEESLTSDRFVIMVDTSDNFVAIERYAEYIAEYNNIRVWPHEIPHGWNSWGNPVDEFKDARYSKYVDETELLKNLYAALRLKPYGLKYFQIDDCYMIYYMTPDELNDKWPEFPHGMRWFAEQIRSKNLIPGIWINPFNVNKNSKLYQQYNSAGWFLEIDEGFPVKENRWGTLDPTHPEVQKYLKKYIRKIVYDWGYRVLKVDFSYHILGGKKYHVSNITPTEAMRMGFDLIRDAAGPDVFIYGIGGPIAFHFGAVDGERITLDTLAYWGKDLDLMVERNGMKPAYRTSTRRYFYHNRVWINHMDCFSFRGSLTFDESMVYVNAMAMLGSILKTADKFVTMPEWEFDIFSKLLPVHRTAARPIDLWRKLYPEILHKRITTEGAEWDLVALFNLGKNKNLIVQQEIPERDRSVSVEFQELGLNSDQKYLVFDFWNQKLEGSYEKSFSVFLKNHSSRLFSVHLLQDRPKYISNNRHFTQGAFDIKQIDWSNAENTLKIRIETTQDHQHKLWCYAPKTYKIQSIECEAIQPRYNQDNELISIEFKAEFQKIIDILIRFQKL